MDGAVVEPFYSKAARVLILDIGPEVARTRAPEVRVAEGERQIHLGRAPRKLCERATVRYMASRPERQMRHVAP
jgi:hypothetical protein